jgi:23S rRNA pseudouridine2604 synthase
VRINKCFKDFTSRREADQLVQEGRVTVNGVVAAMGARVKRGDEVRLDGRPVDWEYLAVVDNSVQAEVQFRYIKYWKPKGVVCTTDQRVRNNIVDAVGYPERVFPVGRLDKDSTGLILLTSDGRLPNAVLRSGQRHDKRYLVTVDREIEERDVATLAEGVVISTPVQRDRVDRIVTARTLPCRIKKVDRRNVEIVLQEGRNRQIRRMMDAVGYEVVALHRVGVMGLTLKGLGEGQWRPCSEDEMEIIRNCLEGADASTSVGQGGVRAELVDCESEED